MLQNYFRLLPSVGRPSRIAHAPGRNECAVQFFRSRHVRRRFAQHFEGSHILSNCQRQSRGFPTAGHADSLGDGGDLMDQCSKHDTPPAFSAVLTNRSGHVLRLELETQIVEVLTDQRFGVIFSKDDDGHH